jgi:type VI secretion system protein ImpG
MLNRLFQQELAHLRELGAEFSSAHPAIAPMLSGPMADPDVERLLEGVAFLSALLRQKLDDDFPEIVHDLMHLIWPHYLRPVPSTTVVAFTPKPTLKQSLSIPAGTHVASVPIEGTSCLFRTAYDVEIHPITLLDASYGKAPGRPPVIKLLLEMKGHKLSDWQPQAMRLHLAGDYAASADLYLLLRRSLKRILIAPVEGGSPVALSPDFLRPVGFAGREPLIPYPTHAYPGFRILQEYFTAPEKFLFLDLAGWEQWRGRGEGTKFEIVFEFGELPSEPPRVSRESFVLYATPAVNVFPHDSDPVLLDHRKERYLVRPSGANSAHYQIYSVDKVVGFLRGTAQERPYVPFEAFDPDPRSAPVYHLTRMESTAHPGFDVYLSVAYPPRVEPPVTETLSIQLTCTNGSLPETLRVGDLCLATQSSPEYVEFRNIRPPTASFPPPLGANLLWRLISHLSLNYLSLARTENLQALLELYLFPGSRDPGATTANRKRIKGIEGLDAKFSDRLVSGVVMRGQEIRLKIRQDHFAGPGDLFLFGCVLDHFLGGYGSINTFTRTTVQEIVNGESYEWPARVGDRPLI